MCSASKSSNKSTPRGPAGSQFPGKLHDLMTYTERQGLEHIISWVQNGLAIMVHDPDSLLAILPLFGFGQTKYRSFQRQLNMWHWERIVEGPFKGAWKHPYFLQGNKLLCTYMSRRMLCNPSIPAELLTTCVTQIKQGLIGKQTNKSISSTPAFEKVTRFPSASYIDLKHSSPEASFAAPSCSFSLDKLFCRDDDSMPLPIDADFELFSDSSYDDESFSFSLEPTPIGGRRHELLEGQALKGHGLESLLEPLPSDIFNSLF